MENEEYKNELIKRAEKPFRPLLIFWMLVFVSCIITPIGFIWFEWKPVLKTLVTLVILFYLTFAIYQWLMKIAKKVADEEYERRINKNQKTDDKRN